MGLEWSAFSAGGVVAGRHPHGGVWGCVPKPDPEAFPLPLFGAPGAGVCSLRPRRPCGSQGPHPFPSPGQRIFDKLPFPWAFLCGRGMRTLLGNFQRCCLCFESGVERVWFLRQRT